MPRTGSYGKRNTVIITWFGAGKPGDSITSPCSGTLLMTMELTCSSLKTILKTEDASDCCVVIGR